MAQLVTNGATLQCPFGTFPSTMSVTPENRANASNLPAATIMDNVPLKNVLPFGMCITLSNPAVASATSAALGTLTPQPCMPVITGPWAPGSPTVMIGNKPALNNNCQLMCAWGGVISVTTPGQITINVP